MSQAELNRMKQKYNSLQSEGVIAYERVEKLFAQCMELRKKIEDAEGDDFDPIPLLFSGQFEIREKW